MKKEYINPEIEIVRFELDDAKNQLCVDPIPSFTDPGDWD